MELRAGGELRARLVRHPQPVLGRRHVGVLDCDLNVVAVAPLVRRVDDAHLGRLDRPQRPRRLGAPPSPATTPPTAAPTVGGAEAARARVGLQLAPAAARLQPARLRAEALLLVVEAERCAHRVARRREQRVVVVVAGDRARRAAWRRRGRRRAASAGGGGSQSSASPPAARSPPPRRSAATARRPRRRPPPASSGGRPRRVRRPSALASGSCRPRRRDDALAHLARRAGGRPRRVRDEGAQRKGGRHGDVRHQLGRFTSQCRSTWVAASCPCLCGASGRRLRWILILTLS